MTNLKSGVDLFRLSKSARNVNFNSFRLFCFLYFQQLLSAFFYLYRILCDISPSDLKVAVAQGMAMGINEQSKGENVKKEAPRH